MYNPQKVIDLIQASGIKGKQLLDYMGKNWNGSVEAVIKGDIRVSKLEKIADFFGVPVDAFFDREPENNGVIVGGVQAKVHHFSVGMSANDRKNYESLIAEKDCRIEELKDTIRILKKQLGIE